jgi:hypothetical protein
MISASTGSTTSRDDELVGQIERCLHRPHNSRKLVFLSTNPKIDTNCRESRGADIELILGGNFRRVLGRIWNA